MERKSKLKDFFGTPVEDGNRCWGVQKEMKCEKKPWGEHYYFETHNDITWVADEVPNADMSDDLRDANWRTQEIDDEIEEILGVNPLSLQEGGDHYKKYPIQPIEYCHVNRLGSCETYAIKYITRHKDKGGVLDIDKAIHCLELLKELEYEHQCRSTDQD